MIAAMAASIFFDDPLRSFVSRDPRLGSSLSTTLLKCLLSNASEKYIEECDKNKIEPDPKKILGMRGEEILSNFYENISYKRNDYGWQFKEDLTFYKSKILGFDIMDSQNGKIIISKGIKVNQKIINDIKKKNISSLSVDETSLIGLFIASDIFFGFPYQCHA